MEKLLCLLVTLAVTSALHDASSEDFQNVNFNILKHFNNKGTDTDVVRSLMDIIVDQRHIIKAMEIKVDTITDEMSQQKVQMTTMKKHITDMETVNRRQDEEIGKLKYDKEVLEKVAKSRETKSESMAKEIVKQAKLDNTLDGRSGKQKTGDVESGRKLDIRGLKVKKHSLLFKWLTEKNLTNMG